MTADVERVKRLPALPVRPDEGHKGTFGRVLGIGGSRGMSGAAALMGLGALRGGAGLVHLAVPSEIAATVAAIEPSYLTLPLAEDEWGQLSIEAQLTLADVVPQQTAVAVGPGLGQSDDLRTLVRWLYATVERPMVVDADALNNLAQMPEALAVHPTVDGTPVGRILTPHPGEFARLLGEDDIDAIQRHREELAVAFARQQGVVLLLKGRGTLITDGRRLAVNTTGNSGMATGGTGDVLTGLTAALLAQRLPPFEAAQLAAHLHGLAGDLAAEEFSQPGLIASDVARALGRAWRQMET